MSREIDERIVQMKFESGQFEKNVQTSIHSLDELKKGLDFKDATKGFENIDKASKGLKFDGLAAGVEALNNRFTLLGITGLNVMNRIANAAIDTGERMVKALSTDQISAGWSKYADKTSAVQTIMSATAKQFTDTGEQMEYVNSQLDKLNWFTDETSYNFLEMVSNIGKFTSNNIDLDQSVTSMQGIATWAAQAGANANEASRAMYNLSQAISVGSVKLIDWKSIENANMATASFKEQVIETALAEGTLIKQGDKVVTSMKKSEVSVSNFNEALSEGWFNSNVLLKVLDKYGAAANRLNEIVDETGVTTSVLIGYIDDYTDGTANLAAISSDLGLSMEETKAIMEEFQDETMQFGLKAFKSAQEAKTFKEAIDSVKDAVSSGWMQTFEYIFGDYEKAKKLWTDVANILYTLFAESGNTRNAMLADWADMGGRDYLIASIAHAFAFLLEVMGQVTKAWRSVFPQTDSKKLFSLTKALYDFTSNLQLSARFADNLWMVCRTLFTVLDTGLYIVKQAVKSGFGLLQKVMAELNLDFTSFNMHLMGGVQNLNKYVKSQTWLTTAVDKFGDILVSAIRSVKEFIKTIKNLGPVQSIVKAFGDIFTSDFQGIGGILSFIGNSFTGLLTLIANTPFPKSLTDIKNFFISFGEIVSEEFSKIGINFGAFEGLMSAGWKGITEALTTFIGLLGVARKEGGKALLYIGDIMKEIDWSGVALLATGVAVVALIYKISDAVVSVTKSLTAFTGIGKSVTGVLDGLKSVFTATSKVVESAKFAVYGAAAIEFAVALGILTASLVALSRVPADDLANAAFTIGLLGATLVGFVYSMSFVKSVPAVAGVLVAFAATIATFVWALHSIDVSNPKEVISKIAAIEIMLLSLVGVAYLMGEYVKPIQVGTWSLVGIVASVWLMIQLFKSLSKEDPKKIASAALIVTPMLLVLAAISRLLNTVKVIEKDQKVVKTTSVMKLIGLVLSLYLLIGAIKLLGKSDPKVLTAGILALIPVFAELSVLFRAAEKVSENAGKLGPMLLGVSLALYILHGVIKKMAELSLTEIAKGGSAIIALNNLVFVPLIKASEKAGPNAAKAGLMLLAMAGALSILQLVVKTLGKIDFVTLAKGVAATSALILSFQPLIKSLGNSNAETDKGLTKLIVIVGLLGAIVLILANFSDTTAALAAAGAMSAILLSLGATMLILDKIQEPKLKTLFAMTGAIAVMAAVVVALSHISGDPKAALANATAMGLMFLAIGVMFKIMNGVTVPDIKKLGTYLAVLATVGGIMYLLGSISDEVNPVNCMVLATAMSEILLALAGAVVIMSNTKSKPSEKNAKSMAIFVGMIGAVMVILGAMSKDVDPVAALAMATGVSEILVALGVAARFMTKTKMPETDDILKWSVFVGAISTVLGVISLIPFDQTRLLALATGIGELLLALSVSIRIISGVDADSVGKAVGTMFALTGLMGAVGVVIGLLSFMVNPDTVLPIVTGMSVMLLALSGCVAILSLIKPISIGDAVNVVGALTVLVGGMALLIYALGSLINGADAITILQNGGEVLKAIGTAIGEFIGGIIGGAIGAIMDSFPAVCQALSDGTTNLLPMFDNLKQIPGGALGMIGTITGMIAAVTAAEFIAGLEKIPIIGGLIKSGKENMTENFQALGEALTAFSQSLGEGVNAYQVKAAAEAVAALASVSGDLKEGGLMGLLFGSSSEAFDKFVSNVPKLGMGLKLFSVITKGIDESTVSGATNAAKMLVELEKGMEPMGGILNSVLFGEKDIAAFGTRITSFARDLVSFGSIVSGQNGSYGVNQDAVDAAHRAGLLLIEMENSLPSTGGIINDWFLGNKDLSGFGGRLKDFANGLVTLGSECATLDVVGVSRAIWASKQLIELEKTITTDSGGAWGAIFGEDGSFKSFGSNLIDLGEGLRQLGSKANVTDFDAIDHIITIITTLGDIGNVTESIKTLISNIKGMTDDIIATLRSSHQPLVAEGKDIAKNIVLGITAGLIQNTKKATTAVGKLAQDMLKRFRDELGIHSPSTEGEEAGEYFDEGVALGIKNNTSPEEEAANKARLIVSTIQAYFNNADLAVNLGKVRLEGWKATDGRGASWQATLERELDTKMMELASTGEKVKQAYAKWIKLQQKGGNSKDIIQAEIDYIEMSNSYQTLRNEIIDAQIESAESMISELDLLDQVRQAEYDRWASSKEGKNASAVEQTAKEMELLVSQLDSVAQTTAVLWSKHQAIVQEFGEDSTEARNAYIKALNSEQKLNETYDSIISKQAGSFGSIQEARDKAMEEFSTYMTDIAPKLMEMGFALEDIQADARRASNWDQAWGEAVASGISVSDLDAIMDKAHQTIDLVKGEVVDSLGENFQDVLAVQLSDSIPVAIMKSAPKSVDAANKAGSNVSKGFDEGFGDPVEKGEYIMEGTATGITNKANVAYDAYLKAMQRLNDGANMLFDFGSPSKVTTQMGEWLMEGFAIGIDKRATLPENSMEDACTNMRTGLSALSNDISALLSTDMDLEPVITPVLNLDEVIAESKQIPGLLNSNTGLDVSSIDIHANRVGASLKKSGTIPDENGQSKSAEQIYNFVQNNYSPKALSRYDIYRQTRNQISQLKGATNK